MERLQEVVRVTGTVKWQMLFATVSQCILAGQSRYLPHIVRIENLSMRMI